MKVSHLLITGALMLLSALCSNAEVRISGEGCPGGSDFEFKSVPAPANNDAATKAQFTLVDGERDPNGGDLAVLHDGQLPVEEDQPAANFFFRAGTDGGRIALDLGSVISVKMVCTYSWHVSTRTPQVYQLYAADGKSSGFTAAPKRGTDPESCGWRLVARVDTRPSNGDDGDQQGVAISDPTAGALGNYRYLLFDIVPTENRDAFGNTFYSEIDVIDANGPAPTNTKNPRDKPILIAFDADGGKYQFTIDASAAPDLKEWADTKLRPVVQEWYPQLVALLPSDGFEAPTKVTFRFRNDMADTPAAASGGRINLNSEWFRREREGEARGAVVHEMVHVVQNYDRAQRTNPDAKPTPGWLVEGIPDYIRWFLYEPETNGAEITGRNLARAKYDASYRITGNFLHWVTQKHDREIVPKLNAAARRGKYTDQLWKDWTGKELLELDEAWRKANEDRLNAMHPKVGQAKTNAGAK